MDPESAVQKGDETVYLADSIRLPVDGEPAMLCLLLAVVGFIVLSGLDHFHTRNNPAFRCLCGRGKKD